MAKTMENPEEPTAREIYNTAVVFAYALANMFNNGEGMVIELVGDIRHQFGEDVDKVIVYLLNDEIQIRPCEREDLEDGEWVNVFDFNQN